MGRNTILLLPGDGVGPEIMAQAERFLPCLRDEHALDIEWQHALIGGSACDAVGVPLPEETLQCARRADGILLGAVGGDRWATLKRPLRPERGLLALRSQLALFANLRPARAHAGLEQASALKPERISGLDLLIVRELTGGIYFGEPRGIQTLADGTRRGLNSLVYHESEIDRVARVAFSIAERRPGRRLCSVDKANVLEATELWREVVTEVARDYPTVALRHMYVDNAAMQMVREPAQFDVILTSNMFGDILSDLAAMLTGSLGMLPSASLGVTRLGLYEPVHGSAPDIAGQNVANPLAMILSLSMLLRYSLGQERLAAALEQAVQMTLAEGLRTRDIAAGGIAVSTQRMGDRVLEHFMACGRQGQAS